jgi:hypothetical protein
MVAQRNGKLAIQNFNVRIFPFPFLLKLLNVICWYASLNQVYVGKEKQTVAEMLPYLRLGYISNPDEMQSILSSEGDTCPVSLPLPWCCYLFLHWFGWVLLKWWIYARKHLSWYLFNIFSFLELQLVPFLPSFFIVSVWPSFVISGHKSS